MQVESSGKENRRRVGLVALSGNGSSSLLLEKQGVTRLDLCGSSAGALRSATKRCAPWRKRRRLHAQPRATTRRAAGDDRSPPIA